MKQKRQCSATFLTHTIQLIIVDSAGDRADVLCVLQDRLLLSDVSVTHCCADRFGATAATTAGSAAETRAAKKVAKCALREPGGYDFTPLVVESYGRRCSATHTLLNLLGRLATDSGRVNGNQLLWRCTPVHRNTVPAQLVSVSTPLYAACSIHAEPLYLFATFFTCVVSRCVC